MAQPAGWRIDETARAAGLSTRNVRAYQSLGLVPGPFLEGRVGRYGPAHLARLRAVRRLQAQGFSLAGIRVLLEASDRGESLADVLGGRDPAFDESGASPRLRLALVPGPLVPASVAAAS